MNQLLRLWNSLTRKQQISLVAVPLLFAAISYGFVKWKHDTGFRVLYSSLAPEDAAAVTQKIREANIEFKLDETGTSVLVPVERIADARLALAAAGLPHTGRIGFELFDRNNLGASDFAEQVNYRRALEGELERTVATLTEVEQARIHITFAKDSVFLDARQPSKATVVLKLKRSSQLAAQNVNAIANLVASAVEGLAPEAVAIVDSSGRLLNRPRASNDNDVQTAETNLEYRHQLETEYLAKISAALGPLLGPERFRASVNVDCDFSSSEQNEDIVEAERTAMISSQTTEESSGGNAAGGTPGTASNLPRPAARASAGGGGMVRRTENVSYQPSRTVRKTISPKGSIRRISTALLVDQTVRWDGLGSKARKTLVPPSAETLKGVHDIIAGITGFTEQRGDQITVETLPFESTLSQEPPPAPTSAVKQTPDKFDVRQPAVIGGAVAVVLLLAGAVFLLTRKKTKVAATDSAATPVAGADHQALPATPELKAPQTLEERQRSQELLEAETLGRIQLPENSRKTEVLSKYIRESVIKDPVNVTNVLRAWIMEKDVKR
jgi:flagellar M-ring protein FliF